MHSTCSRWRSLRGRPDKKKKGLKAASQTRWQHHNKQVNNPNQEAEASASTSKHSDEEAEASTSTSRKKISLFEETEVNAEVQTTEETFVLIHSEILSQMPKSLLCPNCRKSTVTANLSEKHGLAKKINVFCSTCDETRDELYTSPRVHDDVKKRAPFSINRKMVDAFVDVGLGYSGLEKVCMDVGMDSMSKRTWESHLKEVIEAGKIYKMKVLQKSRECVRRVHQSLNPAITEDTVLDIVTSYDGSWHRRGHKSLYGIGIAIDIISGLVVDFEVLSKFCQMCTLQTAQLGEESEEFQEWKQEHILHGECQKNFDGSSNSMEMMAAEAIWKRSEEYNMRFTTLLSDGDAKTYQHLNEIKVYGETEITKEDCINHYAKRAGTGMRNVVKDCRAKGITLGGNKKGQLTDTKITKLTTYYRSAVVNNLPDVDKMKTAIMATLDHCVSTDQKPKHSKCPKGESSWCFYNRAKAMKEKPRSHDKSDVFINENIYHKLKPLYERLSSDELLERCSRGKTQNANEALHSMIWNRQSKTTFVSKDRIELAVIKSIAEFNMGCSASQLLKYQEEGSVPQVSVKISQKRDATRKRRSDEQADVVVKRARRKAQVSKRQAESAKRRKEGKTYGAGTF